MRQHNIGAFREPKELLNRLYYHYVSIESLSLMDGEKLLIDSDADVLRDVALKFESGNKVTKVEALKLMRLASRARQNGQFINRKIQEWSDS